MFELEAYLKIVASIIASLGVIGGAVAAVVWKPLKNKAKKREEEQAKKDEETKVFRTNTQNTMKQIAEKIKELQEGVSDVKREQDASEASSIRHDILSFAAECRRMIPHSQDEFRYIIQRKNKYDEINERRRFANGVIDEEYKYIMRVYDDANNNGGFAV